MPVLILAAAVAGRLAAVSACGESRSTRVLTGAAGGAVAGQVIADKPVEGAVAGGVIGAVPLTARRRARTRRRELSFNKA